MGSRSPSARDTKTGQLSLSASKLDVIVSNPTMIDAYRAGVPGNGKQFLDGSKIMKILWNFETKCGSPGSHGGAGHAVRHWLHGEG